MNTRRTLALLLPITLTGVIHRQSDNPLLHPLPAFASASPLSLFEGELVLSLPKGGRR